MNRFDRKKCRDLIHAMVADTVEGRGISEYRAMCYDESIRPKKAKAKKNMKGTLPKFLKKRYTR